MWDRIWNSTMSGAPAQPPAGTYKHCKYPEFNKENISQPNFHSSVLFLINTFIPWNSKTNYKPCARKFGLGLWVKVGMCCVSCSDSRTHTEVKGVVDWGQQCYQAIFPAEFNFQWTESWPLQISRFLRYSENSGLNEETEEKQEGWPQQQRRSFPFMEPKRNHSQTALSRH